MRSLRTSYRTPLPESTPFDLLPPHRSLIPLAVPRGHSVEQRTPGHEVELRFGVASSAPHELSTASTQELSRAQALDSQLVCQSAQSPEIGETGQFSSESD